MDTVVTDAGGKKLSVGDRFKLYGYVAKADREDKLHQGVVTAISDPDGDVDDEGRSVHYPPKITALFDDGATEDFETFSLARHYMDDDYTYQCDELEKIS